MITALPDRVGNWRKLTDDVTEELPDRWFRTAEYGSLAADGQRIRATVRGGHARAVALDTFDNRLMTVGPQVRRTSDVVFYRDSAVPIRYATFHVKFGEDHFDRWAAWTYFSDGLWVSPEVPRTSASIRPKSGRLFKVYFSTSDMDNQPTEATSEFINDFAPAIVDQFDQTG
jgi:hypothetical protein